jgi:hypothetical protein
MQSVPITTNKFESRSGEVYSVQHYVIKLVSGFLRVLGTNKTDRHDKTEILSTSYHTITTMTVPFQKGKCVTENQLQYKNI